MTPWINIGLVAVFAAHTFFFGRAWLRRGRWYHGLFVAAFILLTLLNALKAAGSAAPALPLMRWGAIGLAALATVGYAADRLRKRG